VGARGGIRSCGGGFLVTHCEVVAFCVFAAFLRATETSCAGYLGLTFLLVPF
jgi:hypothetical protein